MARKKRRKQSGEDSGSDDDHDDTIKKRSRSAKVPSEISVYYMYIIWIIIILN